MLYIMRHGQTDWNVIHKLQGRSDVPLNAVGRAMAARAHDEVKNVHFDVCYASPMIRALETAQIVLAGRDVPIITDDRLVEMCFGEFEGLVNTFAHPECPIYALFKDPEKYTESIGGAESFGDLYARTGSFLKEVVDPQLQAGKDVLVVGHAAMNSSIICQIRSLPISQFWSNGLEQCRLMQLK